MMMSTVMVDGYYDDNDNGGDDDDDDDVHIGNTTDEHVARVCGTEPPAPKVYHTDVVYVRFESDYNTQLSGFRLLFSFHPVCCLQLSHLKENESEDASWLDNIENAPILSSSDFI